LLPPSDPIHSTAIRATARIGPVPGSRCARRNGRNNRPRVRNCPGRFRGTWPRTRSRRRHRRCAKHRQARVLEGHDTRTIAMEPAWGRWPTPACAPRRRRVMGRSATTSSTQTRSGPSWRSMSAGRDPGLLEAANGHRLGLADVVLYATGEAGSYRERSPPARGPAHQPSSCCPSGCSRAAEFALMADATCTPTDHARALAPRPPPPSATTATSTPTPSTSGRGPFTAADVLASRMVADPFHSSTAP